MIGLAGVLFAGLGWLSAMRDGLFVMFEKPAFQQPNFVIGKLRDLVTLAVVGLVLMLSVGISSGVTSFSEELLDAVGLGAELGWLLWLLAIVVGLAASMLLFYAMFRLLGDPDVPSRSLWSGALFGALGFEMLKQLSSLLLSTTEGQPAFQAFGIALILLVWINYFSRVVMYAASWAYTTRRGPGAAHRRAGPGAGPEGAVAGAARGRRTAEEGVGRACCRWCRSHARPGRRRPPTQVAPSRRRGTRKHARVGAEARS